MRIEEGCGADDKIHRVADQLVLNHFLLGFDDMVATLGEVLESDIFFDPVAGAVKVALSESGKEQHRFAQRFARDRAGVDADAADDFLAFDDGDFFADLSGLDRGLLAGRAGADHQHVIVCHWIASALSCRQSVCASPLCLTRS